MGKLKSMQVGEFIRKITTGERYLPYIKLKEGSDLAGHEGFPTLQNYLRGENLKENPINISNSDFKYVKASGIYLPYTIANDTDFDGSHFEESHFERSHFDGAYFDGAHFEGSHFEEASLPRASFYRLHFELHFDETHFEGAHFERAHFQVAHLNGAHFERAHFEGSHFDGAYFKGTYVSGADFSRSDFRGVRNLDRARGLESAIFFGTIVNRIEEAIIRNEFKKNNLELQPGQLLQPPYI